MLTRQLPLSVGLALAAASCVPAPQVVSETPLSIQLFEGGYVEGRWAYQDQSTFPLPEPPMAVAALGDQLWAAFPYQLLLYREGIASQSLPLPGVPSFVRASPGLVVGLGSTLYRPDQGQLPYPALDAAAVGPATYWVNSQGLYQGSRRLIAGSFHRLLVRGEQLVALSPQGQIRLWPSEDTFQAEQPILDALWANDLYLLTPRGVTRYTPNGLWLGFLAGSFQAIQSHGPDLTLLAGRQVIRISPSLEVR